MTRSSRWTGRSVRVDGEPHRARLTGRQMTSIVLSTAVAVSLYPIAQVVGPAVDAAVHGPMRPAGVRGLRPQTATVEMAAVVGTAPAPIPATVLAQYPATAGSAGAMIPQLVNPAIVESPTEAIGACPSIDVEPAAAVTTAELPRLSPSLERSLEAYGRNPKGLSVEAWMESGGTFGGGIPWEGVRVFLQRGAAAGLSEEQLMAQLNNPSFMRAANDPDGGARLLDYIGEHPELFAEVAGFAASAPFAGGWGASSGQGRLFGAFPELGAVYAAMAGPIHTSGQDYGVVDQLLEIAMESGSWGELARRRLDEVLTYGPRARSADKAMARYVAGSGYVPVTSEAELGMDYWAAYSRRIEQARSGLEPGLREDLPTAPTGAARPMALTWAGRSATC